MPTLLELQRNIRRGLVDRDVDAVAGVLSHGVGPERLDIYRNTIFFGLTKALRLAFPAVERLVGPEFFEITSQRFITEYLPHAAYLYRYGDAFPEFMNRFESAASLPYLADVARLEWAVNCAIHAPDVVPLTLHELAAIEPGRQEQICFNAHPSLSLIRTEYPADEIWRAVLAADDQAMAAIDLVGAPLFLLVERRDGDVEVTRLQESGWRFLNALCRGKPMSFAVLEATGVDAAMLLAEHLSARRFVSFSLSAQQQIGEGIQ